MEYSESERVLWELRDLDRQATPQQCEQLRQALDALSAVADYHIFGVCADSQAEGCVALENYARHFDYTLSTEKIQKLPQITGAVYLKFNPRNQSFYVDAYTGKYRGVLISFQSDTTDGYSGTHGHFPADLFALLTT